VRRLQRGHDPRRRAEQVQGPRGSANTNLIGADTNFTTGEGPGVVNAPVAPDVIYVGRAGAVPGLSVVDLNGFGQGTGNPTFNPLHPAEGNTNFPNNPNVRLQGAQVRPPLEPGHCTINAGSAGVFTLTRDSSLNDLLVRAPLITSIGDTMIGHGLDSTFNNGPSPFGCQSGGGNLCASDAKKIINPTINGNSMIPTGLGQVNGVISAGAENLVCWAPHPNPPSLFYPPLCVSPFIGGQEPTSIDTTLNVNTGLPGGPGLTNLLGPGDPFGDPLAVPPIPPTGLLAPEQNQYFEGPSLPNAIQLCQPYMMRQQIGHYLYVIDRARREVVVMNSNRMTVIDRIPTQDPTTLAMSPSLNLLAVANQTANLVSFIDIDPHSSTFHQVVQETTVGERPRGIAWEPGNEDILVANENDNTVSVISAAQLQVRKVVRSQLSGPFDIAITPRQAFWGYVRNVYFAYILNRSGRVAMFESGPNFVNGWGYDDIIGIVQPTFLNPKAIQPDHVDLRSAVWIAHEGPLDANGNPGPIGVPALSKLVIDSALSGALVLNSSGASTPQFRDMHLGVQVSVGPPQLSGIPVDIAFDDMRSWTGLPNYHTAFSVGAAQPINGKQLVRSFNLGYHPTNTPRYMFAAVPNPFVGTGVVDVVRIDQSYVRVDTNPFLSGIQSIPAENCVIVTDYFRQ
jgi:YVTN family beta-propeller protein